MYDWDLLHTVLVRVWYDPLLKHTLYVYSPTSLNSQMAATKDGYKAIQIVHPAAASSLVWVIFRLFTQMAVLTWHNFSRIVIETFTCRNSIPDSNLVMSTLFPLSISFSLATSTQMSPWKNMAMLLIQYMFCKSVACRGWSTPPAWALQLGPCFCVPQQQYFPQWC